MSTNVFLWIREAENPSPTKNGQTVLKLVWSDKMWKYEYGASTSVKTSPFFGKKFENVFFKDVLIYQANDRNGNYNGWMGPEREQAKEEKKALLFLWNIFFPRTGMHNNDTL